MRTTISQDLPSGQYASTNGLARRFMIVIVVVLAAATLVNLGNQSRAPWKEVNVAQQPGFNSQIGLPDDFEQAGQSDQFLAATVVIRISAPKLNPNGKPEMMLVNGRRYAHKRLNTGLGTLVVSNEQTYIVTHDHWKLLDDLAAEVKIMDSKGGLLSQHTSTEFLGLVRHRDGTVMIVAAPPGLLGGVKAGTGNDVPVGSLVSLIHRDQASGRLSVIAAQVQRHADYNGNTSLRLDNPGGEIIQPGNSGGGVWYEGKLVGNVIATVLADESGPLPPQLATNRAPSAGSYAAGLSVARTPILYGELPMAAVSSVSNSTVRIP